MIELEKSTFKSIDLRESRYSIRDSITNARSTIIANFPQSPERDSLLMDLKRVIEIADNL